MGALDIWIFSGSRGIVNDTFRVWQETASDRGLVGDTVLQVSGARWQNA